MLNIVVDTNQFLSGFIYHGMMKTVFDLVLDTKLRLYVSPALKTEVLEKLQEFNVDELARNEVMFFMDLRGILVKPTMKIEACRDKEDNFALELSEESNADYLITRDNDLLDLHRWKQTKIIKPEDFLPLLRKMNLLE
jgi:putative PIN family toxin of toxin-antitoxin system